MDPVYLHMLTTDFLIRREVCATITLPAFHRWPDAPQDVGYLSDRHRHLLTVRVWCQVGHDDRQVEYHQLQRKLRALLFSLFPSRDYGELELGSRSCEAVAMVIAAEGERLGGTVRSVEVWEDNENGSRITLEKLA
jgi:hypothetical protein